MSADLSKSHQPRAMFEPLEGRQLLSAGSGAEFLATEMSPAATFLTPHVAKAATRSYIKQDSTSTTFGGNVHLIATVTRKTGTPITGGVVTFKAGSTVLGTATVNLKGKAFFDTIKIPVGTASLTAVFNGTKSLATSTSAVLTHIVTKSNTVTSVAQADATTFMGVPATFTATVAPVKPGGGVPSGNVQFLDGATVMATVALNKKGRAVLAVPDFFKGSHSITAKFVATSNYNASTSSAKTQVVSEGNYNALLAGNLLVSTRVAGSGTGAVNGQTLVVNYTGYLTNGTKFDSSLNAGRTPFDFTLGNSEVIQGWEKGLVGIKVGETRLLKIPPALAYGAAGQGNIPGNATLIFVVKLLEFGKPQLVVKGGTGGTTGIANNQAPSTGAGTAFGNSAVNAATSAHSFVLSNGGAGSLSFTANPAVALSGSNAADFVLTQPTFPGNGTAVFTVAFKPKAKGARSAVVTIFTNDPDFPSFKFTVTGTGT